jgi:uncharacterized protein (TIGR02594 family)
MNLKATTRVNIRSGPSTNFEVVGDLETGEVIEVLSTEGWCPLEMEDSSVGWVSRKFLTDAPVTPEPKPVPPTGEPVWLRWARSKLGQKEVPGPGDNPEIAAWYKLTTLPKSMWHDETAWCSVFVNAAFELNNLEGTSDARAVSWLDWGEEVDDPRKGDVVVFDWGNGGHHVAFFLEDLGNGYIRCLGGNQSDAVTIANYPESAVMGYMRAPA